MSELSLRLPTERCTCGFDPTPHTNALSAAVFHQDHHLRSSWRIDQTTRQRLADDVRRARKEAQ